MFKIDKQTLTDLHALDWNSASLLRFFDRTLTVGGQDLLYTWFAQPLQDKKDIVDRQQAIAYLATVSINKLFDKYMMIDLERYLKTQNVRHSKNHFLDYVDKLSSNFFSLRYQRDRLLIKQSVAEIALLLVNVHALLSASKKSPGETGLLKELQHDFAQLSEGMDLPELQRVAAGKNTIRRIIKYDYIFRSLHTPKIQQLFRIVYTLDALYGIAQAMGEKPLSFPSIQEESSADSPLMIQGLYNLAIKHPVENTISVHPTKNIWFLTGANMTGKSTLLKSIGACIYLAHLGLPVPAAAMETPLYKGIITSINLTDNMEAGFSHFFAEVNRLKMIGQHIAKYGPMVVMLDELFKGTNYQDAYEATERLIESLHAVRDSVFFISTHITDLGEALATNERVALKYLETTACDAKGVVFTYKLADGVAKEKLGMWFLARERVFETFQAIKKNSTLH